MNKITNAIIIYILVSTIINLIKFIIDSIKFTNIGSKNKHVNLIDNYGKKSWVVITGAGCGQGRDYSLELSRKGFNILLIGNTKCFQTEKIINKKYPKIMTEVIIKDFCLSNEKNFFDDIKLSIENKDISGFISNIAHRYGINPYYDIDEKKIIDIINAKGISQSILLKILLPKFIERKKKSFIIIISALVMNKSSIYDSHNVNTLPYLSIYEGINAYSYFHANTIFEEFKKNNIYEKIDYLNITPAAVITKNTKYFLSNVPFAVKSKYFAKNVIGLLGKYNGTTCGCIEHLVAYYLSALLPIKYIKDKITHNVATNIANYYKN